MSKNVVKKIIIMYYIYIIFRKGTKVMIKERNIVVCVLLSIITCGIYGIYWYITLTDDVSKANEDPNFTGVKSFLLTLVTCGIYGIYWNYKVGKEMYEANQKKGIITSDNSVMYLILSLVGFSIVTFCIVQNELNALAKKDN